MDPLDDLLRSVRGDGVVLGRSTLSPPWALRFPGGPTLTLLVPLSGEAWITRDGAGAPRRARLNDTAVVRGPESFVVTDGPPDPRDPFRHRREVRFPGDATQPAGEPAEPAGDGGTMLLTAVYRMDGHVPRRLLRVLPPLLVLPDDHDCASIRGYLHDLVPGTPSARQVVVDRLIDWILVCTLRDWLDRPEAGAPGWYSALADDVVGPALRAMHETPGAPWTLASLAERAGVSRTTLSKRFTELVGEPPLSYLTDWRMALAADLLTEPHTTVASVARRVGYADAFSFSAAFKRVQGVSPTGHRRGAGSAPRQAMA